jgi:hypothetical protein
MKKMLFLNTPYLFRCPNASYAFFQLQIKINLFFSLAVAVVVVVVAAVVVLLCNNVLHTLFKKEREKMFCTQ